MIPISARNTNKAEEGGTVPGEEVDFRKGTWGGRGSERDPVELSEEGSWGGYAGGRGTVGVCIPVEGNGKCKGPEAELDLCKEHEQGAW